MKEKKQRKCKQIDLTFPKTIDGFVSYITQQQFENRIKKHSFDTLGVDDAFRYRKWDSDKEKFVEWHCTHALCRAYFLFQQIGDRYVLKDFGNNHEHFLGRSTGNSLKKLKENLDRISFDFPQDIGPYKEFQTSDAALKKFRDEWDATFPQLPRYFVVSYPKRDSPTFLLYCRRQESCKWGFKYTLNPIKKVFELQNTESSRTHVHFNIKRKLAPTEMFHELYDEYENCKDEVKQKDLQELMQKRLGLNGKQFSNHMKVYYRRRMGESKPLQFHLQQFIRKVKVNKYEVHMGLKDGQWDDSKGKNNNTDYIVITNKLMRYLYWSYGKVIYCEELDLLQNNVSEKYSILCFSGFNHCHNRIVFGFGICKSANLIKYENILKRFFRFDNQTAETLLVEKNSALIIQALKNIRANHEKLCYINILLYAGKANFARQHLHAEQNNLVQANLKIYELVRTDRYKYLELNVQEFLGYCYSVQQPTFVGMFIFRQKIFTDLRQTQFLDSTNFIFNSKTFRTICRFALNSSETYNSRWFRSEFETIHVEDFLNLVDIRKCRLSMARRIFVELLKEINKLPSMNIVYYNQPDLFLVDDGIYPYTVVLKKDQSGKQRWECECYMRPKTGIPCSHMIKAMVCCGKSIYEEIDKYWLIDMGVMNLHTAKDLQKQKHIIKDDLKKSQNIKKLKRVNH